jgi:hypothetical protein
MSKIIDSNMPLPANTQYKWHECFAKLILEKSISSEFKDLGIDDKPDLQNKELNIGIEVTTAVDSKNQEMERLYTELEYGLARNREKVLKKITSLGGKILKGILIHPVRTRTLKSIYSSFKIKVELLNNGDYAIFKHNYLFITDENIIHDTELKEIISQFKMLQETYKHKFEKVFIYIYGNKLYEIDLKKEKSKIYCFQQGEIYKISVDARTLVEEKEKQYNNEM